MSPAAVIKKNQFIVENGVIQIRIVKKGSGKLQSRLQSVTALSTVITHYWSKLQFRL
jgi:hypothetical protein